jgi:hypothetical protein
MAFTRGGAMPINARVDKAIKPEITLFMVQLLIVGLIKARDSK